MSVAPHTPKMFAHEYSYSRSPDEEIHRRTRLEPHAPSFVSQASGFLGRILSRIGHFTIPQLSPERQIMSPAELSLWRRKIQALPPISLRESPTLQSDHALLADLCTEFFSRMEAQEVTILPQDEGFLYGMLIPPNAVETHRASLTRFVGSLKDKPGELLSNFSGVSFANRFFSVLNDSSPLAVSGTPRRKLVIILTGPSQPVYTELLNACAIAARKCYVLMVDFRGLGKGEGPPLSFAGMCDDLNAMIACGKQITHLEDPDVVVWAHSLAASVAMDVLPLQHPEAHLIIQEPTATPRAFLQDYYQAEPSPQLLPEDLCLDFPADLSTSLKHSLYLMRGKVLFILESDSLFWVWKDQGSSIQTLSGRMEWVTSDDTKGLLTPPLQLSVSTWWDSLETADSKYH